MQEYYKILGLEDGASLEEVESAYNKLKAKYSKDRFLEGEKGNEAAKKLTQVENAYSELSSYLSQKQENGATSLSDIEKLIKDGNYNEAQSKLDDYSDRNAEWHYLQSIIFYKKNWINESLKQLEISLSIEPNNLKYKNSYEKLKQKTEFNEQQFRSGNANYNGAYNGENNRQMGGDGLSNCCSFCATWCCMDMLCSMCCR